MRFSMRPSSLKLFCSRRYFSQTYALCSPPKQTLPSPPPPPPPPPHPQTLPSPLQLLHNKVSFNNLGSDTDNDTAHLRYLKIFCSIIKELSINPRNYTALSNLDSFLNDVHFLDLSSSIYVVERLCRIKKLQRAKKVVLNLKKNVKVSDYFLYSLVIDCLVKDGKIDDVEIVWSEICGSELVRIDVSDYAIYVCKFGSICEIKRMCERVLMGGRVMREQSYMALIGALCSKNEGLLALEVLQEMNNKDLEADDITYVVMFQCFCRNGDLEGADLILRKLARRKYKMDICIYGSFIYGLCKSGKFREAAKLFRKLIKKDCLKGSEVEFLKQGRRAIFQLNCEGLVPEVMAYETYFRSLCSVDRLDEAEMILKKMMKKRTMPEICVYGSFIKALFRAGRGEDAIKFLNVERKKGLVRVDEMARFIIIGLCKSGKVDDAMKIFDDIATRRGFLSVMGVCNGILASYWEEGKIAEAERLFDRIKEGIFGPPDSSSYTTMVNRLCRQGDISKALYIFEEMLTTNIPVNGTLYEMIIRGLCDCERLKQAQIYLNHMIENGHLVSYNRWRALFHPMCLGEKNGITLEYEV